MTNDERLAHSRKFTDGLLQWLRGRGRIAIVVHDNPDPDCLASALALRHLFVMKLGREAVITFSGIIGRSENLVMAKVLEVPLTPLAVTDLSDFQVICMLDTQPGTGNNSLPADIPVDLVIDHHPLREASSQCRWVDVREDYGVTATILYEYLASQEVNIGTKLATALFYAIKSETQDLGREANRPDRDAYLHLFPIANKKFLSEISYPKLPLDYFLTMNNTLANTRIYGTVLVAVSGQVVFPEIVAEMADLLLRLEGIEVALTIGFYNGEAILSIRTTRQDLNAGETIRALVKGVGSAGGHGMMAGGKIDVAAVEAVSPEMLPELLTLRLLDVLELREREPRLLLPTGVDNPTGVKV